MSVYSVSILYFRPCEIPACEISENKSRDNCTFVVSRGGLMCGKKC